MNQGVTNTVVRNTEIPRIGVITSYSRYTNTATVLLSSRDSDAVDEILRNVPCPTYMGIQTASPEPGRMCMVVFKNGAITQPIIVSYFNHSYREFDMSRQLYAQYSLPSYLAVM